MRYPGRSRFDREGDSGAWYGGRPRIGTYLLINLYRLFGAGRINRNARTWGKKGDERRKRNETEARVRVEGFVRGTNVWGRAEGFESKVFYRAF